MEQALPMVKNLERFIKKHGEDAFISRTISKLVDYKIQKYKEKVKGLEKELKKFEHTYHKDSSVFFKEFNEGRLGDDMDFIEWYSLCKMRDNTKKGVKEIINLQNIGGEAKPYQVRQLLMIIERYGLKEVEGK